MSNFREQSLNEFIPSLINKTKINVPYGIRFLSEWKDFRFSNFPSKCIINKQIPGCGFTEYCINGYENVIIASPRKLLIKNKYNQHENDVYLVVNEMENDPNIDKDLSKDSRDFSITKFITEEEIEQLKLEEENKKSLIFQRIRNEITTYVSNRVFNKVPCKILVTYDSYHIVKDILTEMGIFHNFFTVIDEFQSILHDSRFKSSTELQFIEILKQSHSALFVSATPMIDEYLSMLKDFKDLPYFELDWSVEDPNRIIKPDLKTLTMKSAGTKMAEIIETYLKGDFREITVIRNGIPVKIISDEAVFYVNSVNHIVAIIKKMGLTPDQVNILCSNSEENKKKIRKKLGKKFTIGEVPLKGVKPKMFTFCTRTVYLGADFYSTCARTFIFSDSNIDSLAVDISEDLPQILGRQRLDENPWSHSAVFYYKTTCDFRKVSQKKFDKIVENKMSVTDDLLYIYGKCDTESSRYNLANKYQVGTQATNYKSDYVGVNTIFNMDGSKSLIPKVNDLVIVNEIRAFRIQQYDYKDRITLLNTINEKSQQNNMNPLNSEVINFLEKYDSLTTMDSKFRLLCENDLPKSVMDSVLDQLPDSDVIKSYYITLGPEKIKRCYYNISKMKKILDIKTFNTNSLSDDIYQEFKEGDKIPLSEIKDKLDKIYKKFNYKATAKASDLKNYFEVREMITIVNINGEKKKGRCYELLKKKGE